MAIHPILIPAVLFVTTKVIGAVVIIAVPKPKRDQVLARIKRIPLPRRSRTTTPQDHTKT